MVLDIIISNGLLLTMDGPGVGPLIDGAIGIKGKKIIDIGKSKDILSKYSAHRYIDARGKVVLPGLINAHFHSTDTIARGAAQDMEDWLYRGIMPILNCADLETMTLGSMLSLAEAVKTGTTTICDFTFNTLSIVKNHIKIGTRVLISELINEMPESMTKEAPKDPTELYEFDHTKGQKAYMENIELIEKYHGYDDGRILCQIGPQAPDMLSWELLNDCFNYAKSKNIGVHIHVAQNQTELAMTVKRYGKRSVPLLLENNMFNKNVLVAHLTFATDEEVAAVANTGATMVQCSTSVPVVRGRLPRGEEFIKAGGIVGLGSDTGATNHNNNMFGEMKFTTVMHKVKNGKATVFPAWKMLRMATIEGAQCLGIEKLVGSLTVGKKADIVIIDLNSINMTPLIMEPMRNIVPNLVYSANGSEVETVIIDGQIIVDNYKIQTIDEQKLKNEVNLAVKKFSNKLRENSSVKDMPMVKLTNEGYY